MYLDLCKALIQLHILNCYTNYIPMGLVENNGIDSSPIYMTDNNVRVGNTILCSLYVLSGVPQGSTFRPCYSHCISMTYLTVYLSYTCLLTIQSACVLYTTSMILYTSKMTSILSITGCRLEI